MNDAFMNKCIIHSFIKLEDKYFQLNFILNLIKFIWTELLFTIKMVSKQIYRDYYNNITLQPPSSHLQPPWGFTDPSLKTTGLEFR